MVQERGEIKVYMQVYLHKISLENTDFKNKFAGVVCFIVNRSFFPYTSRIRK